MFTGIIETLGQIDHIENRHMGKTGGKEAGKDMGKRCQISAPQDFLDMPKGSSIACSGVCLTLVDIYQKTFVVDISPETLACSTLGAWRKGMMVNLERAMAISAFETDPSQSFDKTRFAKNRFDGHIVAGHVDGVVEIIQIKDFGDNRLLTLSAPSRFMPMIAPKGSVALDGVSLTVNRVSGDSFDIMLVPYTLSHLKWDRLKQGSRLNLEIDILARYVARLLNKGDEL